MFKEIIGGLLKVLENNPRQSSVTNRRTFQLYDTATFKLLNWKSTYQHIVGNVSMRGRRLMARLQVVTKKSLTKLSGTTNFFIMTKNRSTRDIVNLGFVKIRDLISANNSFLRSTNHQLVDQKKKLYFNNESKASG